jgi:hypothetical protein
MEEQNNGPGVFIVGALLGAALGFGAGYLVGRLLANREIEAQVTSEVQAVKAHYRARANASRKGDNPLDRIATMGTDEGEAEDDDENDLLLAGIDDDPYGVLEDDDEFQEVHPEPGTREPHIISRDSFFEEETELQQKISITYYDGDDTLVDERDVPMRDLAPTVGEEFWQHFGELSEDPEVLYIRNRRLQIDFEITRDERSYTETVLKPYGKPQ